MNKKELITSLKAKFHAVNEAGLYEGKTEAGITVWGIGVFDLVGGVLRKRNLTFYTKGKEDNSSAWWGVSEPKPTPSPIPEPLFAQRVEAFIKTKIDANIIKFGYIMQSSELAKKALCNAIMLDKSEKKVIITEDAEGTFSLEVL